MKETKSLAKTYRKVIERKAAIKEDLLESQRTNINDHGANDNDLFVNLESLCDHLWPSQRCRNPL